MKSKNFDSISGFTLTEVLIVIIVSGLLIAFVSVSLTFFSRSILHEENSIEIAESTVKLDYLIQYDISHSSLATTLIIDSAIQFVTNKSDTISYSFHHDYIIRKQAINSEYLKVNCRLTSCYLEGTQVSKGIINKFSIIYKTQANEIELCYHIQYTPDIQINLIDSLLLSP